MSVASGASLPEAGRHAAKLPPDGSEQHKLKWDKVEEIEIVPGTEIDERELGLTRARTDHQPTRTRMHTPPINAEPTSQDLMAGLFTRKRVSANSASPGTIFQTTPRLFRGTVYPSARVNHHIPSA